MNKPLILAISAVAVVTVLASPRLGFSANCTAPVISRPSNQAASYEPQFRYSPGDNLRLTDNLGETSFPEPAAPAAAEAAAVPETPQNFRAVSYSGDSVNLDWDAPETQPDRWLIRYRPIGGSWINAGTTSLNNYYTVTGLSASTSYDFIVYAENGSTAWSGTRSAGSSIATAMTLPTTPANLQAHDYTGTSVRVTWETATPHGADRWLIKCSIDGGSWFNLGTSTVKEYVANNLDPNSTYDFRVYSERGATAWSGVKSQVSSRLSVPERPAQPVNIKVNSYTDSSIYITWETATPHLSDRWLIQCRVNGGEWTNRNISTYKGYVASSLDASTKYEFRVYGERGATAWSGVRSPVSSTVSATTLPAQPKNVKVNSYTDSGVYITWETATPHGADRWLIQCRKDGGAWTNRNISTYKGYVASSLDASATYEFRVYAERGATAWSGVRSAVSNTVSVTTLPAQPKNVKVESFTENSVYITWETASPHGADRWLIQCRKNGGAWTNRNISTYKGYVASSLDVNTTYEFRVYAERGSTAWSGVRSAVSNTVSVTTLPAQPTNLTVTDRQQFSISLSWSTPIPHGADRWLIQRRAIGGAWRNCGTSTNTSFVVTDLSPNTTYEIRVYSEAGLVAWSGTRSQASKSAIETTLIYYGAKPYVQENSKTTNCQGYAFFVDGKESDKWMTDEEFNYFFNRVEEKNLQQLYDRFKSTLEDPGRFLDTYFPGKWSASDSMFTLSSMRSNQWIVCMRIGKQYVERYRDATNPQSVYYKWSFDYHFWYRTDTGRWAHKKGLNNSALLDTSDRPANDSSPGWVHDGFSPFYDSDIRYYRVSN